MTSPVSAVEAIEKAETWTPTLAEQLAEHHKRQMIDTEREAFQAAQSGDKARQSIASTESERHRAVYHSMCLILDDQRRADPALPRAENCGRYLAECNDGRLMYLNHANEWQGCPNFIAESARQAEALKRENAELREGLKPFAECAPEWEGEPDSLHVFFEWNDESAPVPSLPVADFRRARTLLKEEANAE